MIFNAFMTSPFHRNVDSSKWNITDKHEKYVYYYEFIILVATVSFRTNVRMFWKYENDPTLENVDLMSIISFVYPKYKIRTLVHDPYYKPIWEFTITEMGICKTFNSIFSSYQSIKTWKMLQKNKDPFKDNNKRKLLECHYLNKQCFARFSILNTTARYYIHSPYEIAELNSNPSETIEEDEELYAIYRTSYTEASPEVRYLTVHQRKCKYPEEPISKTIPAYSNTLCQMECRSRMALAFCGCRPYFYVIGEGKPCDTAGMSCIGRNVEILINLPPNLAKCSCLPQCTEMNYLPHQITVNPWNSSVSTIYDRETTAKYSLRLPKVVMHKDVIFKFDDLVASFGGFGVLFFGISFISIVEIFFYIFTSALNVIKRVKNYKQE